MNYEFVSLHSTFSLLHPSFHFSLLLILPAFKKIMQQERLSSSCSDPHIHILRFYSPKRYIVKGFLVSRLEFLCVVILETL